MRRESTICRLKDFSEETKLSIIVFLYRLSLEVINFGRNEEMQTLYNALIEEMGLRTHAENVLKAFIKNKIRTKQLTPLKINPGDKRRHRNNPYDFRGELSEFFVEDEELYDMCGNFSSLTEFDVNLIRAVFSGNQDFAKIIACTFLYPTTGCNEDFRIPSRISISEKVKKTVRENNNVKVMSDAFGLSAEETEVLNAAYLSRVYSGLNDITENMVNGEESDYLWIFEKMLDKSSRDIRLLFRSDRKLVSYGLFNSDNCYRITKDACECIFSNDINIFFYDVLKKDKRGECYPLESYSVKKDDMELSVQLLKNEGSANILLYGAPGSGKTEFARSIAKAAGLETFLFKNELEVESKSNCDASSFALSRLNSLLSLKKENSVIIVDEAESVLNTGMSLFFSLFGGGKSGNSKKGTVNTMLENSCNKVIWIMNYTNTLDESTLRRFTYSIKFKEMSRHMLQSIAGTKLEKIPMDKQLRNELVELCGRYHVTGASVDNIIKTVKGMNLKESESEKITSDVEKVLAANSMLLYGKSNIREKVDSSYDLSVLNTSIPAEEMVEMVEAASEYAEENDDEFSQAGIRILFYGCSGTGKTELARYLAQKLNKKILLKRASDILGPYVGQTEAAIKSAFEEAENNGDILLFDEADSFFADRNGAQHSWERTQVNEFLTEMEEFHGILICTTNLKQIMDPAMNRRFHIISEFKPLDSEGIKKLMNRFFENQEFTPEQLARLSEIETVTPGDFGALKGKLRFVPKSKINSQLIVNELCKIQDEKNGKMDRRIGFGA